MADDEDKKDSNDATSAPDATKNKTKRSGNIFSRIFNVFRLHGDDFEKRLQYISKEEASVLSRMKRRSRAKTRITRNLIIFSVLFEVVAVGYAIVTTRSMDLNWKMRAFRVLPMFLLPALSALIYSAFLSFARMCDRRDQKTLERLRAERQAKIDELKEKTNYYTTQQLIQRYDPDPAAKAAAATVLASKLGADSGLKVYLGDESKLNVPTAKSNDVEVVQSSGLRNRKQVHTRTSSTGSTPSHNSEEETHRPFSSEVAGASEHNQLVVVDHYNPQGSTAQDGGWIARIAALLVGEDPTQSYALICGNCHMHNGLARKEDFPYITYYCPHCHALNRPKNLEEHISGSNSPNMSSLRMAGAADLVSTAGGSGTDSVITSKSPVKSGSEMEEVNERAASGELVS
ncbi:hypothetical protein HS088_TW09G01476 [Tripterygium wilfordii]|uniref:Lunapark zinc ribbon domain-containing protein n=1 Tax=Tripterygium wilfordii TaxID=458696 RepID=A0A7J7DAM1_TRIWF|nr:uncharacterized protein At2g24330-like [Tripterygium wilfordii]KAF5743407.1 hypothetical protein HS088_TW09G01476 [Tripterygium wilfordii]